ncbi:hypothetical protein M3A49_28965 [Paraburkholderia sp. CNPSo 3076]|uniref:hypothetical protein n=1 Tax=Paraburkholderia sp. CNPSo 3076 TaxID=2940936 RepID=UPI00225B70E0|nr:hypothetical protein [Paraburkholderia sp. CNPSo 3076]MCX5543472.1 hypothetical protein [Paraburkholderia sp. CNPSo 3076]
MTAYKEIFYWIIWCDKMVRMDNLLRTRDDAANPHRGWPSANSTLFQARFLAFGERYCSRSWTEHTHRAAVQFLQPSTKGGLFSSVFTRLSGRVFLPAENHFKLMREAEWCIAENAMIKAAVRYSGLVAG